MNSRLGVIGTAVFGVSAAAALVVFSGAVRGPAPAPAPAVKPDLYRWACGSGAVGGAWQPGQTPPGPALLYDNLGTLHYPVSTKSPEAQKYFDQGMRFLYGFNHDEAQRSFAKGAELDPTCAMFQWGVALVLGPNYNLPAFEERSRAAYGALKRAQGLLAGASQKEKDLIGALANRYAETPPSTPEGHKALEKKYSDAMREVSKKYPDDLDIATMAAESMMNLRPWDLWTKDGKPQPGTEEIVSILENVLKGRPDHPGANHYYIHAVEASSNPERGLAAAGRLGGLMPGAGHLVHMPSHIYIRVGDLNASAETNRKATQVDETYLAKSGLTGIYKSLYAAHNYHFIAHSAAALGRSAEAIKAARDAAAKGDMELFKAAPGTCWMMPVQWVTLARFGKWDEILAEPAPADAIVYPKAVWHFSRGLAFLGKGDVPGAEKELAAVTAARKAAPADLKESQNFAPDLLDVAAGILGGKIAAAKGNDTEAVSLLEGAVSAEDKLHYSEPPDWPMPARLSLGALLMKMKKPAEAEAVFRKDLEHNRNNPWSYYGIMEAAKVRGTPSPEANEKFQKAWKDADCQLKWEWF